MTSLYFQNLIPFPLDCVAASLLLYGLSLPSRCSALKQAKLYQGKMQFKKCDVLFKKIDF